MAQQVAYFANNVVYTEGPFVHSSIGRIEVEMPGHHCPVLPDPSVYYLLDAERRDYHHGAKVGIEKLGPVIDFLNQQVIMGRIQLKNRLWIAVQYVGQHANWLKSKKRTAC